MAQSMVKRTTCGTVRVPMRAPFNIYCDESCHLERNRQEAMVLGALWCPRDKAREIAVRLREIKAKHKVSTSFEVKWTKVSAGKVEFYKDLIDYFFDDDDLHFRAIIADKSKLDHQKYQHDHDTWYYKMYYSLLSALLEPTNSYRIYLDIKDTCGEGKRRKLHEVLCNDKLDFKKLVIEFVQVVRSHEIEQMQLADLLIGAMSYSSRGLAANAGKAALIARIKSRSGYNLTKSTMLREEKFNLFFWEPDWNRS